MVVVWGRLVNQFSLMARFGGWANERLYGAVSGLSEDAYRKDGGAFFGSIHNTLNHLLVVDRLWTGRIEGRDRGITALDQILHDDFSSLREARTAEDRRLIDVVDGLSDAALERPVTYRRTVGEGEQKMRCDHILLTLFNHQTHHRGQVHVLLTQAGIVPPPLDVVFFLEEIGFS